MAMCVTFCGVANAKFYCVVAQVDENVLNDDKEESLVDMQVEVA